MGDFTMPSLGADMDEGTLLEWKVAVGDHVDRGDIVAVVDTAKSTVEVEVFDSGTVEALLVEPGTEAAVGTPLARIRSDDGHAAVDPSATAVDAEPTPPHVESAAPTIRVHSPLVRRLAAQLDVDLTRVSGSGPGRRITRADVEHAAPRVASGGASPLARVTAAELGVELADVSGTGPGGAVRRRDLPTAGEPVVAPVSAPATGDRRASVRRAIARLMTTSNREIPHYHLVQTFDLHVALDWLAERNQGRSPGERILPAAMLLRATAIAAAHHPELNGFWVDDDFRPADGVHLGVAISLRGGGLVAPVIRDADQLPLDDTMRQLRDLVERSRQGSLLGSQLSPASLTVTNLGERGAEAVFGVIHPPQVALVGFGGITDRPCAVDGLVGVHPMVTSTLSADHRASDGHAGSRFLETIGELLREPNDL